MSAPRKFFRTILLWVVTTYLFWALASLFNFPFLSALLFPVLIPLTLDWYKEFFPFLVPVILSASAAAFLVFFPLWLILDSGQKYLPIVVNLTFLATFLFVGDWYKNSLIDEALKGQHAECVERNSFLFSLLHAGQQPQFDTHALFQNGDNIYFWSYSTRHFLQAGETLRPNLSCANSTK